MGTPASLSRHCGPQFPCRVLTQFCCLFRHQLEHDRLLGMQPVLCLLEDKRSWRVDDIVRYLFSTMRGQAVQEDGVVLRLAEELRVHLIGTERLGTFLRFSF